MSGNTLGTLFNVTTFGESRGPARSKDYDAIVANEEAIATAPNGYEDKLFFMIHWAVRIERARRRGRP